MLLPREEKIISDMAIKINSIAKKRELLNEEKNEIFSINANVLIDILRSDEELLQYQNDLHKLKKIKEEIYEE